VRQACELCDGRWDSAVYKIVGKTEKGEPTENRSASGRLNEYEGEKHKGHQGNFKP
jgi:hypothetical protein